MKGLIPKRKGNKSNLTMNDFVKKVKAYIEKFQMLHRGNRVLVGVSGGADSMCLLSVLEELSSELELSLFVLHIHHGLRGEEADNDMKYVENYCRKKEIEFCVKQVDVAKQAKENGWSTEEAGRILRYREFQSKAKEHNCTKIAVAHHREDTAETVIFQMIRGTGIDGICGISPIRENIIRPLLCMERTEIERYLKEKNISYQTDSSNFSEEYSRNKIRLQLFPYICKELNSRAVEHIANLADQMREYKALLDEKLCELWNTMVFEQEEHVYIYCNSFSELAPLLQRELSLRILKYINEKGEGSHNITTTQLTTAAELAKKPVGNILHLPNHCRVLRTYETLDFWKESSVALQQNIPSIWLEPSKFPFEYVLPVGRDFLCSGYRLHIFMTEYKNSMKIPKNKYTKWFDYDKIENTLELRTRRQKDVIQIHKDGTHKTINRLLIDKKVPKQVRDFCLLLACDNEILWVLGLRSSEKYYVTENTKRLLIANLELCGQRDSFK